MTDKAAVWVIDHAHEHEKRTSQERFHALMPDIEMITLMPTRTHAGWYANYIAALLQTLDMDFDQFVFFDSDTWLVEPIPDVYEVLNVYPLAGVHAPARWTCPTPYPIPEAFPELNTGVLGYTRTFDVRLLFSRWLDVMINEFETIGDNDQGSLRVALWECHTPIWIMPPEYNCRFGFGGFAGSTVKVLHGRGENFEQAADVVNYVTSMRVWSGRDFHERV
jgi:hypothetical protein